MDALQALRSGIALDSLRTLRALDPLRAFRALDPLRTLDRATVHPGRGAGVPHMERVVGLNDVGIALGRAAGQIPVGGHMPLEGDAQARRTLDAL
ncbi:MAG: hypothetical protein EBR33_06860 [Synechococcaceae bacterium WB4_1_0192]|nr:hypothetical protein [Synechococcaceae bacterium WB4_1_0192]